MSSLLASIIKASNHLRCSLKEPGSRRAKSDATQTFDHEGLVANAGLILAGTLMDRLGLLGLIKRWVRTGCANPGPKILTVVAAMLAGGTHIDHVAMLRAGRTGRVLGFKPMAPSTVGTFLRTFTFGHVRQLEAVLSRTLARAWGLGAGPGDAPLVVDLDSTICEVHGKQKQGAAYGYSSVLGYHPLLAARADTGEPACAKAPLGQREAWCASSTSSSPACDAPGPPGRPRCAPTRGSGPGN